MTQPDPRKIRVIAVINQRTGTLHGVTTDQETAQYWLREISDRHGPGSATQTADVIECTGQRMTGVNRRAWAWMAAGVAVAIVRHVWPDSLVVTLLPQHWLFWVVAVFHFGRVRGALVDREVRQ